VLKMDLIINIIKLEGVYFNTELSQEIINYWANFYSAISVFLPRQIVSVHAVKGCGGV
jgi:hypothetical protein